MNASFIFVCCFILEQILPAIGKCPFIYRITSIHPQQHHCFYINSSSKGYDNTSQYLFFIINTTTNSQVIHRNLKKSSLQMRLYTKIESSTQIYPLEISVIVPKKSVGVWFVCSFDSIFQLHRK